MTSPPATGERPWRTTRDGVVLRVRLTPKSSSDEMGAPQPTPEGLAMRAKVRAVPEKGAANEALERLVADWLGVPRRSVSLDTGGKSRLKSILIAGDPAAIAARLEARIAG